MSDIWSTYRLTGTLLIDGYKPLAIDTGTVLVNGTVMMGEVIARIVDEYNAEEFQLNIDSFETDLIAWPRKDES